MTTPSVLFAAAAALLALLALTPWPTCNANSPHGARIGSVILIEGCR